MAITPKIIYLLVAVDRRSIYDGGQGWVKGFTKRRKAGPTSWWDRPVLPSLRLFV